MPIKPHGYKFDLATKESDHKCWSQISRHQQQLDNNKTRASRRNHHKLMGKLNNIQDNLIVYNIKK